MAATPLTATSSQFPKYDLTTPCPKCAAKNERLARNIDKYSRSVFPSVFLVFSVTYWLYYTWFTRED
ncbi:hypothetical protein AB6A40_003210 [Gnathostoma spinigerum]|uniref:Uncharacterized protein n=1 Tax=Gnathostoma spinigerum TaxID=75299 RepID=A0ABD6EBC7_9BILA